jgi:ribosomal protein S18 acetylase RimI-like enzyme
MTGWVGYVRGTPVTTAVTCVDSEAIGVYSVATLREFRGRGYGEATTRFAVDAARHISGLERSILQSTPSGFAMYRRMGYRPMGRFAVYVAEGTSRW